MYIFCHELAHWTKAFVSLIFKNLFVGEHCNVFDERYHGLRLEDPTVTARKVRDNLRRANLNSRDSSFHVRMIHFLSRCLSEADIVHQMDLVVSELSQLDRLFRRKGYLSEWTSALLDENERARATAARSPRAKQSRLATIRASSKFLENLR